MNLKQIRTKVVEFSGRFDLVVDTTNYVDNGADFFIQEGSKFLDRLADTGKEAASGFYDTTVDQFFLELTDCRVIEEVWASDGAVRIQLADVPEEVILDSFPDLLTNAKSSFPRVYSPGFYRVASGTKPVGFLVGAQTDTGKFNGIIFPPADRVLKVEIKGKFYSVPLVANDDENYWSLDSPMLLIWAALYHLEITYRNTEGAKDWLASINNTLFGLEKDLVDQEGTNIKQMKG